MVEALPNAAAQAQQLAARLFSAATAQGQAILASAISAPPPPADARLDQQTSQGQGQRQPAAPPPPAQAGQAAPVQTPSPAVVLAAAAHADIVTLSRPALAALPQAAAAPQTGAPPAAQPAPSPPQPQAPAAQPQSAQTPTVLTTARPPPAPPPQAVSAPAAPPQALATVLAARTQAVITQDSPAPLLADLQAAVAARALPVQISRPAQTALDRALPLSPQVSGRQVANAVANSGVFLEARAATQGVPAPAQDFKAALLVLLQALRSWAPPPADELPDTASPIAEAPAEADDPSRPAASVQAAPPAKGQLRPQPPATPNASAQLAGEPLKELLIHRTEAAISRQTLLQLASAEDGATPAREAAPAQTWLTEIPVSTPQGFTSLPFEISRDGGGGQSAGRGQPVTWRVSFALDVEPAGPVYVHAALRGDEAAVTVLAERDAVARALHARAGELASRLAAAGFAAQISVGEGSPAPRRPRAGRFVDQAT